MKKLLSVVICAVLVCGLCLTSVSAATNYCDTFQSSIRLLRWSMECNGAGDVAEGASFPTDVIIEYIRDKTANDYFDHETFCAEIPASVFEAKAKKCFAIVNIDSLRTFEYEYWGGDPDKKRPYNPEKNAYVFMSGGLGDSTTYVVRGYVKNGSKYTVYSHFVDLAGDDMPSSAVENKDYIVVDDNKCKIMHTLKTIVETDGNDVKFHSWQKVTSFPELSALITPSTKVQDETPVQSKPATSSTQSKPSSGTQSKPTTSSTQSTVSSQVSSTASSEEETSSKEEKTLVTFGENESAKIEAEKNVFPENTVVKIEEVSESSTKEMLQIAFKTVAKNYKAYEITASCDNVSVQPDGKVMATFDIPEDYDMDKVAVFYVSPDGDTEKLDSFVDKENNTVVAELSHFSTYVVAETFEEQSEEIITDGALDEDADGGFPIWAIILIVAVVAIGAGVACFFIFKNKFAK